MHQGLQVGPAHFTQPRPLPWYCMWCWACVPCRWPVRRPLGQCRPYSNEPWTRLKVCCYIHYVLVWTMDCHFANVIASYFGKKLGKKSHWCCWHDECLIMLSLVLVCLVSDICSLYTSVSVSYMCTAYSRERRLFISPLLCCAPLQLSVMVDLSLLTTWSCSLLRANETLRIHLCILTNY